LYETFERNLISIVTLAFDDNKLLILSVNPVRAFSEDEIKVCCDEFIFPKFELVVYETTLFE
jgi:hypothetical protein